MHMHSHAYQTSSRPWPTPPGCQIVEALLQGERAVNDIVEQVDIHQSGVSRHLRILGEAGFVQMRPDGQRRLYSLRPEPFRELEAWVAAYRSLWEGRLDRLGAALERKQKSRRLSRKDLTLMTTPQRRTVPASKQIRIERTFQASPEDVWEMWTTREGIESWWGPEGFWVEVRTLELRPGGRLDYAMIATAAGDGGLHEEGGHARGPRDARHHRRGGAPEASGRHPPHGLHPRRRAVRRHRRRRARGVAGGTRLVLTLDPMHDETWTQRAVMGWESELGKLAKVLEG